MMTPIRALRFAMEIDGRRLVGLAFDGDAALEAFLIDHSVVVINSAAVTAGSAAPAVGRVGRPSVRQLIASGLAAMVPGELTGCSDAEAVRRVAARVAAIGGRPISERTVRNHLRALGHWKKIGKELPVA